MWTRLLFETYFMIFHQNIALLIYSRFILCCCQCKHNISRIYFCCLNRKCTFPQHFMLCNIHHFAIWDSLFKQTTFLTHKLPQVHLLSFKLHLCFIYTYVKGIIPVFPGSLLIWNICRKCRVSLTATVIEQIVKLELSSKLSCRLWIWNYSVVLTEFVVRKCTTWVIIVLVFPPSLMLFTRLRLSHKSTNLALHSYNIIGQFRFKKI